MYLPAFNADPASLYTGDGSVLLLRDAFSIIKRSTLSQDRISWDEKLIEAKIEENTKQNEIAEVLVGYDSTAKVAVMTLRTLIREAKGVKLSRPEITIKDMPKKVIDNFDKYKDGIITKVDFCKICEISRPTLDKYIAILTDK